MNVSDEEESNVPAEDHDAIEVVFEAVDGPQGEDNQSDPDEPDVVDDADDERDESTDEDGMEEDETINELLDYIVGQSEIFWC